MDSALLATLLNSLTDLKYEKDSVESKLSDKKDEIESAQYDLETNFGELEEAISALENLDIDTMTSAIEEAENLVD
tara:strand:- start:931 stop:1158 length:228 start_codon:yes stop_codon:yes gene_type:complete